MDELASDLLVNTQLHFGESRSSTSCKFTVAILYMGNLLFTYSLILILSLIIYTGSVYIIYIYDIMANQLTHVTCYSCSALWKK